MSAESTDQPDASSAIRALVWSPRGFAPDDSVIIGFGFAPDDSVVIGFGLAPDDSVVIGFGLAPDDSVAIGLGFAPDDSVVIGFGLAPDDSVAIGFGLAPDDSVAIGFGFAPDDSAASGFGVGVFTADAGVAAGGFAGAGAAGAEFSDSSTLQPDARSAMRPFVSSPRRRRVRSSSGTCATLTWRESSTDTPPIANLVDSPCQFR